MPRKPCPTDVSDEEWSFARRYLTLMEEAAPQRRHNLREVFNALRWLMRAGAPWRLLPMTSYRRRLSTNRATAGWRQAASKQWSRICARSSA